MTRERFYRRLEAVYGPRPWAPPVHSDGGTCDVSPRSMHLGNAEFGFDARAGGWSKAPAAALEALLDPATWHAGCR